MTLLSTGQRRRLSHGQDPRSSGDKGEEFLARMGLRLVNAPLVQTSSMWHGTSIADIRPLSAQTCAAGRMPAFWEAIGRQ